MATFQSDIAARTGKLGRAGNTDQTLHSANLRFVYATIIIGSALAANDILELATLPQGARVLPHLSSAICHADPGTALVLDIGTSADVDRFADGLVLSSGGSVPFTTPAIPAGVTASARLAAATLVYATVMTATTITDNSKITFAVAYLV